MQWYPARLAHLSPLKWEHINLTGDYHSRKDAVELEFGGASVLAARLWFN